MQCVKAASGKAKVPQVFIGGKLIGGSDELAEFLARHEG
jgi:glutaredoxin